MVQTPTRAITPVTLDAFLQLPETSPAREYCDGEILQKPMPKSRHSRLQGKLCAVVNEVTEPMQLAYGFPELRCTFGGRSLVPDIAVLRWAQIQFNDEGEPLADVSVAPCWAIEILSPQQSSNRVTDNLLHCLSHGSELGWLLDPGDRSILSFLPGQQPRLDRGSAGLPVPDGLALHLSAEQVFGWLKMA